MSKDNIKGSSPFLFHLQEKCSESYLILRFLILSVCLTVIFLFCPSVCLSICLSTLSVYRPTLLLICLSVFLFVCFFYPSSYPTNLSVCLPLRSVSVCLPCPYECLSLWLSTLHVCLFFSFPARRSVLSFFLPTLIICLYVCLSSYPVRHTNRQSDRQMGRIFKKIRVPIFEV